MIKSKAPKDMTAPEFEEYLEKAIASNVSGFGFPPFDNVVAEALVEFLIEKLNDPAPNPFTPDQIAWMREEQRSGYNYAAMDEIGTIRCYMVRPYKKPESWTSRSFTHSTASDGFLSKCLSWDDPKPLCFADYAPLGKDE